MRTYEEYKLILTLWEEHRNKKLIAEITGIPRRTVTDCIKRYGNLSGLEAQKDRASKSTAEPLLERIRTIPEVSKAYAYLFGLYLGDGCISKQPNKEVYRLRIFLDKSYPGIVKSCEEAIGAVFHDNTVHKVSKTGCWDVYCYSKHHSKVFPQDGDGPKHEREIKLEAWQQIIVDAYPLEFFRGLYHSDGSRASNIVNGKDYPRYMFTNTSVDILRFFTETCDKLNLHWTTKGEKRSVKANIIYISQRKDVAWLDERIGPKA